MQGRRKGSGSTKEKGKEGEKGKEEPEKGDRWERKREKKKRRGGVEGKGNRKLWGKGPNYIYKSLSD